MQSRLQSLIEATLNTSLAYSVGLITQLCIFPAFGINLEFRQNLMIAAVFTIVSVARNYVVRRMFNWWHHHG